MTDPEASPRYTRLAQQFVALADTLVDDFDLIDLLDGLVRACVDLLDVTTAGLMILDARGRLRPVAASTEATRVLELFQLQNDEGPCLDCIRTGDKITVADIADEVHRWPLFAAAASASGFQSIHAVPMRLRRDTIGSLNLFNAPGPPLSEVDQGIAQALADVATIGILQQRSLARSAQLATQLQSALDTRIVIEQAKGVLAEYGGVPMGVAFEALRTYARCGNLKVGDTAQALVCGVLPPSMLIPRRKST